MYDAMYDAGNGRHSQLVPPCERCGMVGPCDHYPDRSPAIDGVNACCRCHGDIRSCGHFGDCRDYYGPYMLHDKPNWMSNSLWAEAALWCAEHQEEVEYTCLSMDLPRLEEMIEDMRQVVSSL